MATPPDEFVAARNALVKQLKRDGDRESAAAIAAMRRPAWTDWALNVVADDDGEIVDRFAEAASEMREAQKAAFAGRGDVDLRGSHFGLDGVPAFVAARRVDPWGLYEQSRRTLSAAMRRALAG